MPAPPIDAIRERRDEIIRRHGPWTAHTIHLGDDLYTDDGPSGRIEGNGANLRRIVQIASDVSLKPLADLRVLDLACLEGMYGIELARHGAEVVGVEIREEHVAKAQFAAETLGLTRYTVRQDDVRNLGVESYGRFDLVLCIGILYHLDAPDVFAVIERMSQVCTRALVVDTHVATARGSSISHDGRTYRGRRVLEHLPWTSTKERAKKPWASIDNTWSTWLTATSLSNALQEAGFTSVYRCDIPAIPGRRENRQTFVAIKATRAPLKSIPSFNDAPPLRTPERTLTWRALALVRWVVGTSFAKLRHWRRS